MRGAGALEQVGHAGDGGRVVDLQVLGQPTVGERQRQPGCGLPVHCHLDAGAVTLHTVAELEIHPVRPGLRADRIELVVDVVEHGQVKGEVFPGPPAVPGLVGVDHLGLEPLAAEQAGGLHALRAGIDPDHQSAALLEDGRGAHRPGRLRPQRMALGRLPQQLGAGLPLAAGEIVVLVLGARGQPQPVGEQGEFILEEAAVQVVGAVRQSRLEHLLVEFAAHRPVAGAQGQAVAAAHPGFVLQVRVEGVELEAEVALVPVLAVVVGLDGEGRIRAHLLPKAAEQVAAAHLDLVAHRGEKGRPILPVRGEDLVAVVVHQVALQGPLAARVRVAVQAEAALGRLPGVVGIGAAVRQLVAGMVVVGEVEAARGGVADPPTVPAAGGQPLLGAGAEADQGAVGVLGLPGDDVDHAVDRVGAPHGGARSADHLDPLDVLDESVLLVPEGAAEGRRVDRAAVHEYEQLVRGETGKAARGHRPGGSGDPGHLQPRRHGQGLGHSGHPGTADILLGDDEHCRGRIAEPLLLLGHRGDGDVHQLGEVHIQVLVAACRGRDDGAWRQEDEEQGDGGDGNGAHRFVPGGYFW